MAPKGDLIFAFRKHLPIAATAVLLALIAAVPASAASFDPYDGRKPFRCQIQRVGTGTAFPEPAADPMCVRYNKRNQNIAALGVLDFLAAEPARFGAAANKCFYFQRDWWRGSIDVEGEIETYHWKGGYFIDLASGVVGGFVKRVRLLGEGGDPSWSESLPEEMRAYIHTTGAGGMLRFDVPADPRCAARIDTPAEAQAVYRPWYLAQLTG